MTLKRNWFIYLALIIYLAVSLLILNFGMFQLWDKSSYPYLMQVGLIAAFFACYIFLNIVFFLLTRPILLKASMNLKWMNTAFEILFVLAVLAAGTAIRIYYIKNYPVAMESDYKFYYDVAVLMKQHLLNTTDNEYITLFPNTYGYAYLLSIAFRIFGASRNTCLYLNMVLSMLTALFCYGIGKKIAGSVAGLSALLFVSFWPSQIVFSNINGTEAAFSFFLYGAAFLTVVLMKWKIDSAAGAFPVIMLHVLCGVAIALSNAIRPMGLILLIAVILCFLSINEKLIFKDIHELSAKTIFLSKGFLRAFMVLLGYLVTSMSVTAGISQSIENNIAGGGAMGYSLMVGMNIKSDGGYNEAMMNFLYSEYDRTESAKETNDACMKAAIEEIKSDPLGIAGLLAKKFFLVWSNDDYATTTNNVTMNNQGFLSKDRENLLSLIADINNIYYLFIVFFSAIGVIFLMRKDNIASLFAVFFVGTVALLIVVEMQNRYHYYALQTLSILAAGGIGFTFDGHKQRSLERIRLKSLSTPIEEIAATSEGEHEEDINTEALEDKPVGSANLQTIDVLKAIKDGHIKITAAKSYADELNRTVTEDKEPSVCDRLETFTDYPIELWEEYNQDLKNKQIQMECNYFERKKEYLFTYKRMKDQAPDRSMSNAVMKEILLSMEAGLLRKKATLEEEMAKNASREEMSQNGDCK